MEGEAAGISILAARKWLSLDLGPFRPILWSGPPTVRAYQISQSCKLVNAEYY